MPEITLKKNTIYLNKYIRTETDRTTFFYLSKKTSIGVQGQGASRYGRGKVACSPRNAISIMFLACVAGAWKEWTQERTGVSACLPRARPFFLAPTTSKRRLCVLREQFK